MASNFKNSAGTDLDSLFLVNNQNAGAIGFTMSDGTDLGNRYSNASTKLNQTIGYKNNAGTDLGYLRSNKTPASSGNITISKVGTHGDGGTGTATIDGVKLQCDTKFLYGKHTIIWSPIRIYNLKVDSITFPKVIAIDSSYNIWQEGYRYKYENWDEAVPKAGTYTVSFTKG